ARRAPIVIFIVPIPAPLPDIPMHIVKPPGVGPFPPHRLGPTFWSRMVPRVLPQHGRIIPERVTRLGPRPAGILPLRLRRQAIALSTAHHHLVPMRDDVVGSEPLLLA